jgi:hypothetical protein
MRVLVENEAQEKKALKKKTGVTNNIEKKKNISSKTKSKKKKI